MTGLAGRWVSADLGWSASRRKPAWQPSAWVFGVAWPMDFVALAMVGTAIGVSRPVEESVRFLVVLVVSVVLALSWAWSFHVPHRLGAAAVFLGVGAASPGCSSSLQPRRWSGGVWVLVPYAVWLTLASGLSVGYRRLSGAGAKL